MKAFLLMIAQLLTASSLAFGAETSPAGTIAGPGVYNVYFGYLHSHTGVSDGVGTPAQAFAHARDKAGLDFFAVTDHDYYPDPMTDADWSAIKSAADQYNEDGRFVTFWGFEWTSDTEQWQPYGLGLGHVTVIGSDDFCSSADAGTRTLNQLVNWLSTRSAIALFNHPGQYGTTFDGFDFARSDAFVGMELWNRDADYYFGDGFHADDGGKGYYDEALLRGWYIGAGGGQDNHSADWGTTNEWRIAVLAPTKTRADILEAFRARRFYATRDRNLVLTFTCNGQHMGSKIAPGNLDCGIEIRDGGNEVFSKVELVVNGTVVRAWIPHRTHALHTHALSAHQGDYLYVRTFQANETGWVAISSPIFVTGN